MGIGLNAQTGTVSHPPRIPHRSQPWYAAYMASLFESDPALMLERIKHAEQLIVAREIELFRVQGEVAERRALNSALQALHALRGCLGRSPLRSSHSYGREQRL